MVTAALTATLSLPAVVAGWYLAPMALRRRQEQRLRSLCASTRSLVLTYDDGPGADLTPRLLDLLGSRGARATFFLAAFRALERPQIADRIAADGHEIGCHGHAHLNAWSTWPWRAVSDVRAGYRTLAPWVPSHGLYRPPYGKITPMTWAALRRRKAPIGWWTIVAGDVNQRLPQPTAAAQQAGRAGGGVVLLHDFDRERERAEFVLATTEALLDAADRQGWTIRTLGELTKKGTRHAA
ncbi:MAG: polysaccharide deacetylase family protein [Planctomycetota bacterium]|jgi:peptidoglycan/xylan/chitin deacetylase (PgdA/CDA1 family)